MTIPDPLIRDDRESAHDGRGPFGGESLMVESVKRVMPSYDLCTELRSYHSVLIYVGLADLKAPSSP